MKMEKPDQSKKEVIYKRRNSAILYTILMMFISCRMHKFNSSHVNKSNAELAFNLMVVENRLNDTTNQTLLLTKATHKVTLDFTKYNNISQLQVDSFIKYPLHYKFVSARSYREYKGPKAIYWSYSKNDSLFYCIHYHHENAHLTGEVVTVTDKKDSVLTRMYSWGLY